MRATICLACVCILIVIANLINYMDQINKVDSHSEFYTKKLQVILTKRDKISHDSYLFRFDFKNPKERLGMLVT
jgi:hypothetical protein